MKKKRFLIIILCFITLPIIESGLFLEILWHGWGGFGDISLEYTKAGKIGITVLLFLIPLSVLAVFLKRIVLCMKTNALRELLLDCICGVLGLGIGLLYYQFLDAYLYLNYDPFFVLGRGIAWFFIEVFGWMKVPVAG